MKNKTIRLFGVVLGLLLLLITAERFIVRRHLSPNTLWVGYSEEYRFACLQIYRLAFDQLKKNIPEDLCPWAVVMDIDDTCLSTVDYRRTKELRRLPFLQPTWQAWCQQEKGIVVAGAAEFTEKVKDLGGIVILLTKRKEELRQVTEENLRREGLIYDALLMENEDNTKTEWMQAIKQGGAIPGQGPLEVVMLVGDKLSDFYADGRDYEHYNDWGTKYIIIPNPMNHTAENEPD